MSTEPNNPVLLKASFNPIIRAYIIFYVSMVLLSTIVGIPLMIIWLLGVGKWYSRHYFDKLECELTHHTLRFKKGILLQIEKTIPLENIQDMTFIEGPLLRHFNLCILKIETAGQSHHNSNEMKLVGINDAPAFRAAVLGQRQKLAEKKTTVDPTVVLTEIRESLLRVEDLLKMLNKK
ncbi:PH domain-containing protein [bacterium]|nr:PH domain-containing protein [bacterium]